MDDSLVSYYRLGIRLRQAALTHKMSWGTGCPTPVPPRDATDVKFTLGRLVAAFERWSESADAGQVEKQGEVLLDKAAQAWDAICQLPGGRRVDSMVGAHLEQLEASCREFVTAQHNLRPEHEAWFSLGLEIVQVEDIQDYAHPPKGQKRHTLKPKWTWKHARRVAQLLRDLRVSVDQLLPDDETQEDSIFDELPKHWAEDRRTFGWLSIETGLQKLLAALPPVPQKIRPAYDRDHQFLEWYNDKTSNMFHSYAKIRDRWNELHPDRKVTADVVKSAIRKAKQEAKQKTGRKR